MTGKSIKELEDRIHLLEERARIKSYFNRLFRLDNPWPSWTKYYEKIELCHEKVFYFPIAQVIISYKKDGSIARGVINWFDKNPEIIVDCDSLNVEQCKEFDSILKELMVRIEEI